MNESFWNCFHTTFTTSRKSYTKCWTNNLINLYIQNVLMTDTLYARNFRLIICIYRMYMTGIYKLSHRQFVYYKLSVREFVWGCVKPIPRAGVCIKRIGHGQKALKLILQVIEPMDERSHELIWFLYFFRIFMATLLTKSWYPYFHKTGY